MTLAADNLSPGQELTKAVELMQMAIRNPPGLKIVATDHAAARKLRRQLYGVRRRARSGSDTSLDSLSITVTGHEVRLIVREGNSGVRAHGVERILPLGLDDLPTRLGSRGAGKLGLIEALSVLDLMSETPLPPIIR
jgi:hypothetical protein